MTAPDAGSAGELAPTGTLHRAPLAELRSAGGWSWAYDCLHGHVRKHLAMLGPQCVELASPPEGS